MKMFYWQALLIEWRKTGRKDLSIPYIVGSQMYLKNCYTQQSIKELIISITENQLINVYLTYCSDIDGLILCYKDEYATNLKGVFPNINGIEQTNLFVTSVIDEFNKDINILINQLIERHQNDILNSRFSRIDRAWQAFSINEINFIQQTFRTYNL